MVGICVLLLVRGLFHSQRSLSRCTRDRTYQEAVLAIGQSLTNWMCYWYDRMRKRTSCSCHETLTTHHRSGGGGKHIGII